MTDPRIQEICNGLSVCVSCYEKIHAHLKNSSRCHICFHPIPRPDYSDLRWIADEQVVCCGESSCEEQMINLDKLVAILDKEQ